MEERFGYMDLVNRKASMVFFWKLGFLRVQSSRNVWLQIKDI